MIYESLLLLGVLALTFLVPHLILGVVWGISVGNGFEWLHVFVVLGMYFIWFWQHGGQTLAMQTWRIRLVNALSDAPISFKQALFRYTLSWFSVWFFGAGLIWALFDRDRQFLHDRLAGTRLIFNAATLPH